MKALTNILTGAVLIGIVLVAFWTYVSLAMSLCAWLNIGISHNGGFVVGNKDLADTTLFGICLLPALVWVCWWLGDCISSDEKLGTKDRP